MFFNKWKYLTYAVNFYCSKSE